MMDQTQADWDHNPLRTEPVGKLLWKYAVPTIISTLIGSLYNIVDQVFIGQRIGFLGNAATTVAYPLTILSGALTLLISNGSSVNFNVLNGRGEKDKALNIVGNGLSLLTFEGLFLALLIAVFSPWFVNLCGATAQVFPYALTYVRIIAFGMPFLVLTSGGTLLIRSDGSPRYALFCSLAGVLVNFVLDWLFLFPFNMGIAGAALATVTGQVFSALMVLFYMGHFKTGKLLSAHFRISTDRLKEIVSIGAAASLNQAAMLVMNLVLNSSLRYYGDRSVYGGSEALAGAGVVTKINFLFYSTIIGCSIGGAPIMGFNYGARQYNRVKETYFLVLRYALIVGAVEIACFWLFPRQILSIFGSGASGYQDFALRYMHIFMLLVILAGLPPISMNTMSSIKKPGKGILISLSKQLALIALLLLLPHFFGINGVLYSGPTADLLAGMCSIIVIQKEFKLLGCP